jgi:hypothetical protein
MPASVSTEYIRPLIVILVLVCTLGFIVNYFPLIFTTEHFVGAPYMCGDSTTRDSCMKAGGIWAADGRPSGCATDCTCCMPNMKYTMTVGYPEPTCPASTESFTITSANEVADGTYLPASSIPRNPDGTMTDAGMATHVGLLEGAAKLAKSLTADEKKDAQTVYAYLSADEAALAAMKTEFCYYNARYRYAVTQFLQYATAAAPPAQGSSSAAPANNPTADDWLTALRTLARRMIDMLSIMTYITQRRMTEYGEAGPEVAKRNADLIMRLNALKDQKAGLDKPTAEVDVSERMMAYTKEKARANRNLIALYSFLNLVALGMLFYVYRAT